MLNVCGIETFSSIVKASKGNGVEMGREIIHWMFYIPSKFHISRWKPNKSLWNISSFTTDVLIYCCKRRVGVGTCQDFAWLFRKGMASDELQSTELD